MLNIGVLSWSSGIKHCKRGPQKGVVGKFRNMVYVGLLFEDCKLLWKLMWWLDFHKCYTWYHQELFWSFWMCCVRKCWGALIPVMGHLCFRKDFSKFLWSTAYARFVGLCFASFASECTSVYVNLLWVFYVKTFILTVVLDIHLLSSWSRPRCYRSEVEQKGEHS